MTLGRKKVPDFCFREWLLPGDKILACFFGRKGEFDLNYQGQDTGIPWH